MRFIPTVYSSTGGSLPRSDERAKADFIRQRVRHGWTESDAIARYDLWVARVIDTNPDLDDQSHQELANRAITGARNSSRAQDLESDVKRQIRTGLLTWLPVLLLSSGLTGCAGSGIQQASGSDLGENSKIVLSDRTGNVDGHKRPFAREYIVAPGRHTVGVCGGAALCEKYYYVRFDTKPGYTYMVQQQQANVSVSNRQGYVIDTQGYGLDLRDGVTAVVSFKDETRHGN